MSNLRDKATDAIKRIEKTNRVIISELQTDISATDGMGDVHVTAFVGTDVSRPRHYTLRWDSKRNEFVEQPSIASQFKQEYNDFRLSHMTKQELFALLQKANRRRQREVGKWKKKARCYRDDFIRERDAHAAMCREFTKYREDLKQRERILTDREAYFNEWKDNVNELAQKEGKRLAYVEHIKRCNECDGRTWHKRYKMKVQGFQEYVTQMLKFVNDVLRDLNIPDIEKARMVDMRNSLIDSRDFLAKETDDKSHMPDEWLGSTK